MTLECLISVAVVKHQHDIAVELLDAKTANVDKPVVKKFANVGGTFHVETATKGDLAYHFTLKEPIKYDDLEEGDIVGFYKDEESGETIIQLNPEKQSNYNPGRNYIVDGACVEIQLCEIICHNQLCTQCVCV